MWALLRRHRKLMLKILALSLYLYLFLGSFFNRFTNPRIRETMPDWGPEPGTPVNHGSWWPSLFHTATGGNIPKSCWDAFTPCYRNRGSATTYFWLNRYILHHIMYNNKIWNFYPLWFIHHPLYFKKWQHTNDTLNRYDAFRHNNDLFFLFCLQCDALLFFRLAMAHTTKVYSTMLV